MTNSQQQKIDELSKNLGPAAFMVKGDVKELTKIIRDEEDIEDMLQGRHNNKQGILVATSKRILFINKGVVYGLTVLDFSYDKMTSIDYTTGILEGKLTLYATGNATIIDNVIPKKRVREFGENIRSKLGKSSNVGDTTSVGDQIEKLFSLKQKGILTDEEFANQKQKLLAS